MVFELVEVKKLSREGLWDSLSLRLEATDVTPQMKYTIHAVVPYDLAGFTPPTIGDKFNFEKI